MKAKLNRREFAGLAGLGTAALLFPGAMACRPAGPTLKIGYTFITWGYRTDVLEEAVKNIAALGYHSFETFGWVMEEWEEKPGGIGSLIEKYQLPLQSAFCMLDVLEKSKIEEEAARLEKWCSILKKYGGNVIVFTGRGKRGDEYNYMEHRETIAEATNAYAKVASDKGLTFTYHQHTNTPVETREELYDLVERVDTDIVKLAPDIGQLLKGGTDPVGVVSDFLPLIRHVHLKDFSGGKPWVGYCPLGQGKVDLPAVLELLESKEFNGTVMAELDPGKDPPISPAEAARASRDYLLELGYKFNI